MIKIEKKIYSGEITTKNKEGKNDYEYFTSNPSVKCLLADMELVDRCWDTYNELIANKDPDRNYNNIKTWFKNEEDVHSITMCGKTTVKAPIMTVLSVFAEIDLIDSFIDSFEKIDVVKQFSNFRILNTCKLKMPMFVSARDLVTMGIGMTLTEEKSVLLAMKSVIDEEYLGTKVPKETSNYIRIVLNFGFYLLNYVDDSHTELSLALNVDPKVPMIPWFILNTFLKEVAYYIVLGFKERMEKLDGKIGKIYNERREKRKEFYKQIQDRIIFDSTNTTEIPD